MDHKPFYSQIILQLNLGCGSVVLKQSALRDSVEKVCLFDGFILNNINKEFIILFTFFIKITKIKVK